MLSRLGEDWICAANERYFGGVERSLNEKRHSDEYDGTRDRDLDATDERSLSRVRCTHLMHIILRTKSRTRKEPHLLQ